MEDDYWSGLYLEDTGVDISDIESYVSAYPSCDEELDMVHNEKEVVDQNVVEVEKGVGDKVAQTNEVEVEKGNDEVAQTKDKFEHIDVTGSLLLVRGETLDELEQLYKKHVGAVGFTPRKGTQRVRGGKISEKYIVCACEGKSNRLPTPVVAPVSKDGKRKTWRKKVPNTRTGCKAYIRIKLEKKKSYWEVKAHVTEHNHPLTRPEWQYLNRSERGITAEQGAAIERMEKAGLKPSAAYRVMVQDAGGVENVGFTKKDHLNYVNKYRMKNLQGGDAQKVVDDLAEMDEEDPNFYYRVLLDEEGKLAAIYWRDAMMREDFILYGDVVVFDTTYNTNRYNFPCSPFVGVNNHWSNVMFGCAFICNEKTDTFVWVFEKFKKSMGGKVPVTIFTDQDAAISAAIARVFKDEVRHRLCLWHIIQNSVSHLGDLNNNEEFKAEFHHCLRGCVNEVEFEDCWKKMIEKYGLQNHSWLNGLYDFKNKWSTALSKDFFSAGILSSQRSESTNHAICFNASRTTSLHGFLELFNSVVADWRNTEIEKEHRCSRATPVTSLKNALLKHAAEIYTLEIFKYFQYEFKASVATKLDIEQWSEGLKIFKVAPEDEPTNAEKVVMVIENEKISVNCSCKHFESVGWLCFHALRALHTCNVSRIPAGYILMRWSKFAKSEVWDAIGKGEHPSVNAPEIITWKQQLFRKCNVLLLKSQRNLEARKLVEEAIENLSLAVAEIMLEEATVEEATGSVVENAELPPAVADPARTQKKGRPKIKKITEKFTQRKKLRPEECEFGNYSPPERLF